MVGSDIIFPYLIGTQPATKQSIASGLIIALSIISLWAVNLFILLHLNVSELPIWLVPILVLWQMFLYTGLFITAHDAMHGSVYPQKPKLNHFIGSFAVFCYATFSYRELLKKHQLHHRYPASDQDPDFHDGEYKHPVFWYFHFMKQYWGWKQFVILSSIFQLAHYLLHIPESTLLVFWVLPPILSSVQLFYFGTFLTHRETEAGYANSHRAKTNPLPPFWSFVTCYHFGYHQEHHEYPYLSWWQLPAAHRTSIHEAEIN